MLVSPWSGIMEPITGNSVTPEVSGQGRWSLTTHGTWRGDLFLEKSEDNGASWHVLRRLSSQNDTYFSITNEEHLPTRLRVRSVDVVGNCFVDLQFFAVFA